MRHASRICLPALLIVVLGVMGSRAAGASQKASNGIPAQAKAVTAGVEHTCALTRLGAVKCWGYNGHDELGTGDPGLQFSSTPVDVVGLNVGVTEISAGVRHSCAVTAAGTAKCWGVNYGGALGDGSEDRRYVPVDVVGLSGVVSSVSAGYDRSCALLGGAVKCWGTDYGYAPIEPPGLESGVLAVSAGNSIGCAITGARGVKCWGFHYGPIPVDVPGLNGVSAVTARGLCALLGTGAVKCWGGDYGWTPVDVPGLPSGVRAIDAAGGHVCALMTTGGVKCWGLNDHGQLGDGTTTDSPTPVDVVGITGATSITSGVIFSCAVLGAGGIKCWGGNAGGVLGDGTLTERHSPVSVVGFGPAPCVVPIVVGKRLAKARSKIVRAHCRVGKVGRVASTRSKNVVVRQSPRAGKRMSAGSKVRLVVSRG